MIRQGTAANVVTTLHADDDWRHHAACREEDPELHFPVGYDSGPNKAQIEEARAVCARCPFTGLDGPCLTAALKAEGTSGQDYRYGIYAGTTPRQRWAMTRPAAPAPRPKPIAIAHGTPAGAERHKQLKEKVCDACKAAAAGVAA